MSELATPVPEGESRELTAAEIGPALTLTRASALRLVDLAVTAEQRLPVSLAALAQGRLSLRKLEVIAEHTTVLDDAACAAVEAGILPRAVGQTVPVLGAHLAKAVLAADPAAGEARRLAARQDRRVSLYPGDDGMSHVHALLPAPQAQARELAADATWRRILTDPESGTVLDVGVSLLPPRRRRLPRRSTYAPPTALARHVRIRDETCRFPGCRQPAARCDLDHTTPHPKGATAETNLNALCRRHHRTKTFTRWRLQHLPGAVLQWISPTGHTYRTYPWAPDPPERRSEDPPPSDRRRSARGV